MPKLSRDALIERFSEWIEKQTKLDPRCPTALIRNAEAREKIANLLADKFPSGAPDADLFGVIGRLRSIRNSPLFMTLAEKNEEIRQRAIADLQPKKWTGNDSVTKLFPKMTAEERLHYANTGEIPDRFVAKA